MVQNALVFHKLNVGWNAHPNGSDLELQVIGDTLTVQFPPNCYLFPEFDGIPFIQVHFHGCSKYRTTPINDHAWYLGQCRFSGLAPAWGEFYEIVGDTRDTQDPTAWINALGKGHRHFHFYLRDETLEVKAQEWKLEKAAPVPGDRSP
jgi:hypothetical protein